MIPDILKLANVVLWDFDGVIKDSVEVKSIAFEKLFESFGSEIAKKVKNHHEQNGGMSRFDKLPIYIEWSGQSPSPVLIKKYSERFSNLVTKEVIDSNWVPGILDYLNNNSLNQKFFLITATPQLEIEYILNSLHLTQFFHKVIGSPTKKDVAIKNILEEFSINPNQSVMVGDSVSDYDASSINSISFILRCTSFNQHLQKNLDCPMIDNYYDE